MPRPTTGAFREPGSSLPGFVPALREHDLAAQLDELAHNARLRESQNAARALAALSGSDPILFPISSQARPRVAALLKRHATELAKVRASPERRFLNQGGIENQEAEIRQQFTQEFDALEAELTSKLEDIMATLAAKRDALRGGGVREADWRAANEFADRLTRLGPELGLGELVAFVDQAGTEERSKGELRALVPVLEAAYRRADSPWGGRDELRRIVAVAESLCDGGANAAILEARLDRGQRLSGEIAAFCYLARTGGETALNATVTGDVDPDHPHGSYALLPEQAPPDGPPPEDKQDWRDEPQADFRRISVSPQQRAADAAARAAQGEE